MENKKCSLSTVFLVIAIILITVIGAFFYIQKKEADKQIAKLENNASELQKTIDNLQEKIDNVSNIVSDSEHENIEIPEASNISENEEETINGFKGIWITGNGEKLLAIDYGKRFCAINKSNNSKEYGTYTVKDHTSSSVPTITLTYTSGKTLELELTQGSANYLMSNDRKIQYVEYEAYYFGAGEGDEGIFNKEKLFTEKEIIDVLQMCLDLESAKTCGPGTALVTLGLYKDYTDSNAEKSAEKTGFIKTSIKYSDFKEAMLEYMTEECYQNEWNELFENEDGYLCYANVGATGVIFKVNSIEKIENGYTANVTASSEGPDTKITVNFKVDDNKCIVKSYEFN